MTIQDECEMSKYIAPSYGETAFTCIFCQVLTTASWQRYWLRSGGGQYRPSRYYSCKCDHCEESSLWQNTTPEDADEDHPATGRLILPTAVTAPNAHIDMPEDCRVDFEEAREIAGRSPRGAAALLRLCLQRLCIHLGGKGKKVDDDIAQLVKRGVDPKIQQAFDVVRVTGNHAVHPGSISLEENPEHVTVMFEMINLIVEEIISRPKKVAELFQNLPANALEAIMRRDAPKP